MVDARANGANVRGAEIVGAIQRQVIACGCIRQFNQRNGLVIEDRRERRLGGNGLPAHQLDRPAVIEAESQITVAVEF